MADFFVVLIAFIVNVLLLCFLYKWTLGQVLKITTCAKPFKALHLILSNVHVMPKINIRMKVNISLQNVE